MSRSTECFKSKVSGSMKKTCKIYKHSRKRCSLMSKQLIYKMYSKCCSSAAMRGRQRFDRFENMCHKHVLFLTLTCHLLYDFFQTGRQCIKFALQIPPIQIFWKMQHVRGCTIVTNNSTLLSQNISFLEKITFLVFGFAALLSDICRFTIPKLWSDSCSGMSRLIFCASTVLSTIFIFFHDVLLTPRSH